MRAFLLVALLALIALVQAFVPRAALPKKAGLVVKAKMAPFQRWVVRPDHRVSVHGAEGDGTGGRVRCP